MKMLRVRQKEVNGLMIWKWFKSGMGNQPYPGCNQRHLLLVPLFFFSKEKIMIEKENWVKFTLLYNV